MRGSRHFIGGTTIYQTFLKRIQGEKQSFQRFSDHKF